VVEIEQSRQIRPLPVVAEDLWTAADLVKADVLSIETWAAPSG
jgi:hypothetical protein